LRRCRALGLTAVLLGLTAGAAFAQTSLTWTAGQLGGGWYDISTGIAALSREKAGITVKVIPGGGAQNPVLVDRGDAEIGLGLPPLLGAAARAEDRYRDRKMVSLRALTGNMSVTFFHFYVAADLAIAKLGPEEIFRGRKPIRLAIPKPGTSDVWVFEKIMEFYGLCAPGKIADCYKSWEEAGARLVRASYADQAACSGIARWTPPSPYWRCRRARSPQPPKAGSPCFRVPSRLPSTWPGSGSARA
jgi:NMT1-like family